VDYEWDVCPRREGVVLRVADLEKAFVVDVERPWEIRERSIDAALGLAGQATMLGGEG